LFLIDSATKKKKRLYVARCLLRTTSKETINRVEKVLINGHMFDIKMIEESFTFPLIIQENSKQITIESEEDYSETEHEVEDPFMEVHEEGDEEALQQLEDKYEAIMTDNNEHNLEKETQPEYCEKRGEDFNHQGELLENSQKVGPNNVEERRQSIIKGNCAIDSQECRVNFGPQLQLLAQMELAKTQKQRDQQELGLEGNILGQVLSPKDSQNPEVARMKRSLQNSKSNTATKDTENNIELTENMMGNIIEAEIGDAREIQVQQSTDSNTEGGIDDQNQAEGGAITTTNNSYELIFTSQREAKDCSERRKCRRHILNEKKKQEEKRKNHTKTREVRKSNTTPMADPTKPRYHLLKLINSICWISRNGVRGLYYMGELEK
jgi:hypothetical protein